MRRLATLCILLAVPPGCDQAESESAADTEAETAPPLTEPEPEENHGPTRG